MIEGLAKELGVCGCILASITGVFDCKFWERIAREIGESAHFRQEILANHMEIVISRTSRCVSILIFRPWSIHRPRGRMWNFATSKSRLSSHSLANGLTNKQYQIKFPKPAMGHLRSLSSPALTLATHASSLLEEAGVRLSPSSELWKTLSQPTWHLPRLEKEARQYAQLWPKIQPPWLKWKQ